jgi:glucosamine--fructose-6-phosphate aminotransferase (isomerizing)
MCGIVGYIGPQNATPIILNGLKRLEYRGYDSAGLAVIQNNRIEVRRDVGKLNKLAELVSELPVTGHVGIGHTRWATHGEPSARNAHPHVGMTGNVVLVHNGIVENYLELRNELSAEGVIFNSDTDTEVIVQLVELYASTGISLVEAAQKSMRQLKGAHGIVLMSSLEPDKIVAARIGNAGRVVFLESRQVAIVSAGGLSIQTLEGKPVEYKEQVVAWDPISAEKGEYRHFMLKEINEQVRSLTDTLAGRIDFECGQVRLPELKLTSEKASKIQKIIITACGTASHAGMIGKILLERITHIPTQMEIASEFRYGDPIVDQDTVVLAISQSGETADTLAAMEEGRKKGAAVWSIVNAIGTQAMRIADGYISMQVGPEIGVASTKAFTAPIVDLYMLAILLADLRGSLDEKTRRQLVGNLLAIPDLVGKCLDRQGDVEQIAEKLKETRSCLYLGRGINMPIAYEGALKLKEISYIHAEGYPAGEMKHGPIALIDREMPVVVIAPRDPWYEKMISQIQQAKARGGTVIAVATDGDELIPPLVNDVLWVPNTPWLLSPVVTVIPLQLLAYHIAAKRGLDIDQPRNLAKSVTVE